MDYAFGIPDTGRLPIHPDDALDFVVLGLFVAGKRGARLLLNPVPSSPPGPEDLIGTGLPSVERFVKTLNSSPAVTRPVGDIYLIAHGNVAGQLAIPLAAAPSSPAAAQFTYESVRDAFLNDLITLAPATITSPAGANPGTRVRIMGCNIGRAEPLMAMLRNAFNAPTIAPKHLAVFAGGHVPNGAAGNGRAVLYYLAYDFILSRPAAITDPKLLVDAFFASGLKTHDGRTIARATWASWLPAKERAVASRDVKIRLVANETAVKFEASYLRHQLAAPHPVPLAGAVPSTPAARRARAKAYLSAHAEYLDTADFPLHQRHGFATLDAFVDAHAWEADRGKKQLLGLRVDHNLVVPITDAAGILLHDLEPIDATAPASRRGLSLKEADTTLFWTG